MNRPVNEHEANKHADRCGVQFRAGIERVIPRLAEEARNKRCKVLKDLISFTMQVIWAEKKSYELKPKPL
jgi:hypothetical protein